MAPQTQAQRPLSIPKILSSEQLPRSYGRLADDVLVPIASWMVRRRQRLRRCAVVGICGPQGSGKSTAVTVLRRLLEGQGLRAAALSIDDLYLTRADRLALARDIHPLLATRGPPGTHDHQLGLNLLQALRAGDDVRLPRFDKAADDRHPPSEWELTAGGADIILFEGWCVGARPEPSAALHRPINALEHEEDPDGVWRAYVNRALADYEPLFARLDALIQFLPPSFEVVASWRDEQEAKLRARSPPGAPGVMTPEQVARFVAHYERLTRHMIKAMPARADVVLELGRRREPRRLCFKL